MRLILYILLFPLVCCGQTTLSGNLSISGNAVIGVASSVVPCSITFYSNSIAQSDFSTPNSGALYAGVQGYDPGTFGGGSVTVCAVTFQVILETGVDYRASIWTTAGNLIDLGTQQGSFSDTHTATGSQETIRFTFSSPITLNSGTTYCIVFSRVDGTNFGGIGQLQQSADTVGLSTSQWDSSKVRQATSARDFKLSVIQ